jgi:hypothetical protein
MEPVTLASAAVAALAPYLANAGEGAAKKIGEKAVETGGKLLGWMRARLSGRGQEALNDLTASPESTDNQADLRKQLAKALEANPELAAELKAMLPADAGHVDIMNQHVSGPGAKAVQVKGSGNTTTMS